MNTSVNTNNIESKKVIKWTDERTLDYTARCKELEAEALAQMPYKVGDTVTSRYGDTGRVIEMYPEITGDTDSPHLVYEYDGKPTVNVVILDADGKRHCAHWSLFTLQEASEIRDDYKVGDTVKWKLNGKTGIIEAICERDMGPWGRRKLYTVNFDKDTEFPTGVRCLGAKYTAEALEPYDPDSETA